MTRPVTPDDSIVGVFRRAALLKLEMEPRRAHRLSSAQGETGLLVSETGGGGGAFGAEKSRAPIHTQS